MARLFFALWPDSRVREQLAIASANELKGMLGRPMGTANLHLTLLFLGEIPDDRRPCVEVVADRVRVDRFALDFDRIEGFHRARVVWAGVREVPPPLLELVENLRVGVRDCALPVEERPYTPHLTLLRDARLPAPVAMAPVHWQVTDFALVTSAMNSEGARYAVARRWPLQGGEGLGAVPPPME